MPPLLIPIICLLLVVQFVGRFPELGRLLHKPKGVLYAAWGGVEAVRYAIAHRFGSIDIDVHVSKDGILMAVHWPREWLLDGKPLGPIRTYTASELARAVPKNGGPWRIQPVASLLAEGRGRVVFCLEAKPDEALELASTWAKVKADADRYGCRVVVMTIQRQGTHPIAWEAAAERRLQAAKTAGLPVVVLSRGWLNPARWGFVDAWKINRRVELRWGKDMPPSIPYVGPGSPFGASAHPKTRIPVLAAKPTPKPKPKPPSKPPLGGVVTPKHPAPAPPYIPAAKTSAGNNKPINRIVIHSTVSPSKAGTARKIAAYFAKPTAKGSAHYVIDAGETLQCVYDGQIAWHAPPNRGSLGVELCDNPSHDVKRWDDDDHKAILKRAATLVAQLCLAYDVPIARLSVNDLKEGKRGICGHVDVSNAFKQSTHWDPGAFPWRAFMASVRAEAERIKKDAVKR